VNNWGRFEQTARHEILTKLKAEAGKELIDKPRDEQAQKTMLQKFFDAHPSLRRPEDID